MASFNQCILVGNLARDPEVKFLQSGTAVCEFGLAVNDRIKKGNDWIDEVSFFDVTFFGRTAEVCGEYLSKGANVLVAGRLKQETWEKDGQKRSKIKVIGDRMQMMGAKRGEHDQTPEKPAESFSQAPPPANDDIPF
jgi:single-strand DNA-binding protein